MSAIILLIPFLFNLEDYILYYDFASLLCVQQWIFETNSQFKFFESLLLTVVIMFAQSFTLNLIYFDENLFSNSDNIYQACLYIGLTIILANPISIKFQDRIAAKYEPFPYSVMMIDKVGQALTISKLIEAFIFDKIPFTNLSFILSTLLMSQIPIIVLFIGLTDYHSTKTSYSKIKELALENSIIYLLTSSIFLYLKHSNIVKLDSQIYQFLSIIQFVLYSTIFYQVKKAVKSRNQSKIKQQ
ncbi:unnamed protein product [Paramecium pentaurelia]|uniref:Uncharacterized protein n=1 Tax=Paramecium pentaurelia TaxID=43138 RepID=A0A8S1SPE1_9CILI|nr:unnamed protein product [Paramecium pentaurelia]